MKHFLLLSYLMSVLSAKVVTNKGRIENWHGSSSIDIIYFFYQIVIDTFKIFQLTVPVERRGEKFVKFPLIVEEWTTYGTDA